MSLPICVFYKGDAWYLWYTLRQMRLTNPSSPIYLLSDRHRPQYDAFVHYVPLDQYFAEAEEFAGHYRHLSSMPPAYELICFQRWFVVKSFMARNGITSCVVVDPDVMVYTDLSAEQLRFASYDLTVSAGKNPQMMFLPSLEGLERFCAHLTDMYLRRLPEFEAWYSDFSANGGHGGVCDMTAFADYRKAYPERVANLSVVRNGSAYDNNVRCSEGYAMRRGYKHFTWMDGRPYGRNLESGERVRFHTLHFQGGAKLLIPYFGYRRDASYFRQLLLQTPLRRSMRGLLLLAGR
ncbi:MAG: hypothetical protein HGA45_01490 [Chloroflexales bacterium]|nr:hypothetical protein [Chloroflexales bacterium]